MRFISSMLAIAFMCVIVQTAWAGDDAKSLLEKIEQKIVAAKTLKVSATSNLTPVDIKTKGTMIFGEKDKMRSDLVTTIEGTETKLHYVTDGMKVHGGLLGLTREAPKGVGKLARTGFARIGFGRVYALDFDFPSAFDGSVKSAKFGKGEKIGEVEARTIEFEIQTDNKEVKITVKLWIDPKTSLPLKRSVHVEDSGLTSDCVETYSDWQFDGKVDPRLFEIPKTK